MVKKALKPLEKFIYKNTTRVAYESLVYSKKLPSQLKCLLVLLKTIKLLKVHFKK